MTASAVNFDSHFLLLPGGTANDFVVGIALTEDAVVPPSGTPQPPFGTNTDSAGYGVGTRLQGAYGIVGAKQSTTLDVAYVVIPNDGLNELYYDLKGTVATVGGTFDLGFPEPAGLSIAGVGALSVMFRLRRGKCFSAAPSGNV